jgi:hypothetical protein
MADQNLATGAIAHGRVDLDRPHHRLVIRP